MSAFAVAKRIAVGVRQERLGSPLTVRLPMSS